MKKADVVRHVDGIVKIRYADIYYNGLRICELAQEINLHDEKSYVFRFDWDNFDKCGLDHFFGVDIRTRKDEYVRSILPYFIDMRTPPDGRDDVPAKMKKYGMERYDRFEYMCLKHENGDGFYVELVREEKIQ